MCHICGMWVRFTMEERVAHVEYPRGGDIEQSEHRLECRAVRLTKVDDMSAKLLVAAR